MNHPLMDSIGTVKGIKVSDLEAVCQNGDPSTSGIFEVRGNIIFSGLPQGMAKLPSEEWESLGVRLLLSLEEVRDMIAARKLELVSHEELVVAHWVEKVDPTSLGWMVLTREDFSELYAEESEQGIVPPQVH